MPAIAVAFRSVTVLVPALVNVHALVETVPANTQVIGILPVVALMAIISVMSMLPIATI